jgi:4-carboxymuconolactone decarboxylase
MSDETERAERGVQTFQEVLGWPMQPPGSPLTEAARDFVFSEVWSRPGLDRRSRRWITLACVCAAGSDVAMRTYMTAALNSGDISEPEMREFVLQFAVFQGFPKAATVEVLLGQIVADLASKKV